MDELEPGDRVLTQRGGLTCSPCSRAQPSRDVLADPIRVAEGFTPQQEWVLQQMAERFHLRVIYRDRQGFVVVSPGVARVGAT